MSWDIAGGTDVIRFSFDGMGLAAAKVVVIVGWAGSTDARRRS